MRDYVLSLFNVLFYIPPATGVRFIYLPVIFSDEQNKLYANELSKKQWAQHTPCYAQKWPVGQAIFLQIEADEQLPAPVLSVEKAGIEVYSLSFIQTGVNLFAVALAILPGWEGKETTLFINSGGVKWAQSEPILPTMEELVKIEYYNAANSEVYGYSGFLHNTFVKARLVPFEGEEKEFYTNSSGGETRLKSVIKPGYSIETALCPAYMRRILRYALDASYIRINGVQCTAAQNIEEERESQFGLGTLTAKVPAYRLASTTTI
jgi:hypothetical protein